MKTGLALTFTLIAAASLAPGALAQDGNGQDANQAAKISAEIFGPRVRLDAAYGAFQRGFYLTALDLALPRADKDDGPAQTLIAEIYAQGLGVAENLAQAASWYALADKNGDVQATFELALLYQDGRGVPENREKAAELFKKAAAEGHIEAKYNLALLHVEGAYAEPNLIRAAQLLQETAEAKLPEAQYDYGIMLIEGAGVPPDLTAGAEQIRLAAEEGLGAAQIEYATLLYLGRGVERDLAGAIVWYDRAASAGNPVAQNRLAKLYAVGEGVELDFEIASMWRALARRNGLTDPSLDRLLVSITPGDLAAGEERARFWPDSPPTASTDTTTSTFTDKLPPVPEDKPASAFTVGTQTP